MNEDARHFEVIFMSCDVKQSEHENYFKKMPWLALPFKDPRIQRIAQKFNVSKVPHLVAINREGKVLNNNAVLKVIYQGPEYIDELLNLISWNCDANSSNLINIFY